MDVTTALSLSTSIEKNAKAFLLVQLVVYTKCDIQIIWKCRDAQHCLSCPVTKQSRIIISDINRSVSCLVHRTGLSMIACSLVAWHRRHGGILLCRWTWDNYLGNWTSNLQTGNWQYGTTERETCRLAIWGINMGQHRDTATRAQQAIRLGT